jgi:hypothetical protein
MVKIRSGHSIANALDAGLCTALRNSSTQQSAAGVRRSCLPGREASSLPAWTCTG